MKHSDSFECDDVHDMKYRWDGTAYVELIHKLRDGLGRSYCRASYNSHMKQPSKERISLYLSASTNPDIDKYADLSSWDETR